MDPEGFITLKSFWPSEKIDLLNVEKSKIILDRLSESR
jgi:hypothetical protein